MDHCFFAFRAPQPGYYHFIYTVTPALNKQVEELKVLVNGAAQTLVRYLKGPLTFCKN